MYSVSLLSLALVLNLLLIVRCQNIVANTSNGTLLGFSPYPGVQAFLGIPFAQPPIGNLRFAPPQPLVQNFSTPLECYQSSPGNFQLQFITAGSDRATGVAESEDILTINIWKPATQNGTLPVMIFLFPGAFTQGATAMPGYDGTQLVAEQGIMVATINYRVNIFGFPNSPAIATKNLGLLDQRMGVEWLRDNIHAFGGDPTRMVLSGQSAGSQSVAIWSYAYPEDPIVSGFIETSGQPGLIPPDDGSSWVSIANTTGCTNSNAAAELECMRSVPGRTLKRAMSINNQPGLATPGVINGGVPAIDNVTVFATAEYAARGKAGAFAKLPLLVSNVLHENDLTLPFSPATGVNVTLSDELTLTQFHCPVSATASYWASQNISTWRYLYAGSFAETQPYPWMRPFHGADLELIFAKERQVAYQDLGAEIQYAAKYIRSAVAAFVKDPLHGLEDFGWPRYNPSTATLVNLFGNNSASVSFSQPSAYDRVC